MPSAPSTRSPRRLRRALAAVALLAAALGGGATATPAAAAAFSAGILDAGDSYSFDSLGIGAGLAAPGATFDDTVSFTLTAALGVNSQVAFTSLPGLALVDGASVRLYRDGNPVALVSGVSGAPGGGLFSNAFSVA
ncbi:MAG: hypothetical protein JNM90_04210, partial [Burkholderiales bacterium]|nr:hypothetical protein [Burkholderiales bacterium]